MKKGYLPSLIDCFTIFIVFLFLLWIKLRSKHMGELILSPPQEGKRSKISPCPTPFPEDIYVLEEEKFYIALNVDIAASRSR